VEVSPPGLYGLLEGEKSLRGGCGGGTHKPSKKPFSLPFEKNTARRGVLSVKKRTGRRRKEEKIAGKKASC